MNIYGENFASLVTLITTFLFQLKNTILLAVHEDVSIFFLDLSTPMKLYGTFVCAKALRIV